MIWSYVACISRSSEKACKKKHIDNQRHTISAPYRHIICVRISNVFCEKRYIQNAAIPNNITVRIIAIVNVFTIRNLEALTPEYIQRPSRDHPETIQRLSRDYPEAIQRLQIKHAAPGSGMQGHQYDTLVTY